jgi:hypothetical protein
MQGNERLIALETIIDSEIEQKNHVIVILLANSCNRF